MNNKEESFSKVSVDSVSKIDDSNDKDINYQYKLNYIQNSGFTQKKNSLNNEQSDVFIKKKGTKHNHTKSSETNYFIGYALREYKQLIIF